MSLVKNIRKVCNGGSIPLDNTLLSLTGWKIGDEVRITVDGARLIITPTKTRVGKERLRKVMGEIRAKYGPALRELAK